MGVKLGLDTLLRVQAIRPLMESLRQAPHTIYAVCTLAVQRPGGREEAGRVDDPAAEALDSWNRSSRSEYNKILGNLETAAKWESIKNRNIIKPVEHPEARGLWEIVSKAGKARLFVFYDTAAQRLIVAAGAYWKQGRTPEKERVSQDRAILRAANARQMWIEAQQVPGFPDWRVWRQGVARR